MVKSQFTMNFRFSNFQILKPITVFFGVFVIVMGLFSVGRGVGLITAGNPYIHTAFAEEDEDEDEEDEDDEDEDEDEDRDDDGEAKATETRYVTHYEVRYVPQTTTVIPEEYRSDLDGDTLVDAIDPDPDTHQREYFTDDDDDTVPNVFDRHPGEDDFAYFDSMYDTNDDGIIDDFESLARE